MEGKWIWLSGGQRTENERACFVQTFRVLETVQTCEIHVAAISKYALYCNGRLVGRGPIRAPRGVCYCDTLPLESYLRTGLNYLAVHVWSYGWSTYQSLYEDGGLLYEIVVDGQVVAKSDETVKAHLDLGQLPFSPKRNVNLGFSDYYDGRSFTENWTFNEEKTAGWQPAALCPPVSRTLLQRPIRQYHTRRIYPTQLVRVQDVKKAVQVLTINTRQVFFGDRRDADETIFNGLIGFVVTSEAAMSGRVSFPNRTWNGIIGTFRIGETIYPVKDRERDIAVDLPAGSSLFLMQINGKFDDLYSHIEFRFPGEVAFRGLGTDRCAFVVGPTAQVTCGLDGTGTIYDDTELLTELDHRFFACSTIEQLQQAGAELRWVAPQYVMSDAYLLSLARLAEVVGDYSVRTEHLGVLWNNTSVTTIELPACGDYRRILLDFGDLYVGNLNWTVWANEGTILDIYCFENMYRGDIDFTIGLNNGMRYICRDGWQSYSAMTRIGVRYALISVRNAVGPVKLREFSIDHTTYSSSNLGSFQCNDEQMNHIWKMCRQSHELCTEDTFTDSPTYEQAFWLGDAQTSAIVNALMFGDYDVIRRCLVLAPSAKENTPMFNALTPTDWGTSIPMWTMHWLIMLLQYLEVSGDYTVLDEVYDSARDVLNVFAGLLTEDGGLLLSAWNHIDWAPLGITSHCVPTAYEGMLTYCFRRFAALANLQGETADGTRFRALAGRTARYLDENLWDSERKAFCDSWSPKTGLTRCWSVQTHTLLVLYDAIDDPVKAAKARQYLLDAPEDFIQVGSPFMLYYLYECWAKLGRRTEIFEDIKRRWGEMVRYESTTCWEVFPGFYENSRTRSYCNSWSATPAALMQKYLLGIRREADAYAVVAFDFPETELRWCRGAIPTPYGPIFVDWNKDIGEYLLRIPQEITLLGEPPRGFRVTIERTK